jgi:hypothetical protein
VTTLYQGMGRVSVTAGGRVGLDGRWREHNHDLLIDLADCQEGPVSNGEALEDYMGDLEESMRLCNEDRHNQHGFTHTKDEIDGGLRQARAQMLTTDFRAEYIEGLHREAMFKKWGGVVPAAVIQPAESDPDKFALIQPDFNGNAHYFEFKSDELSEVIPSPRAEGATKLPFGWKANLHRWSIDRRIHRELRKQDNG